MVSAKELGWSLLRIVQGLSWGRSANQVPSPISTNLRIPPGGAVVEKFP